MGHNGQNYAYVYIDRVQFRVPRLVLELKLNRPIKKRYFALHICDNPWCVEREHIYEGTAKNNTDDMMKRGRHISVRCPEKMARGNKNGSRTCPERRPRGKKHWCSVLTPKRAKEMQRLSKTHTQHELVEMFDVSKGTVYNIQQGLHWTVKGT